MKILGRKTKSPNGLPPSNPLGEIINLVSWDVAVLDLELCDNIKAVLVKHTQGNFCYSNKYIMLLVAFLADSGFLYIQEADIAELNGRVIFIKRI